MTQSSGAEAPSGIDRPRPWKDVVWGSLPRRLYVLLVSVYAVILVPYTLFYDPAPYELTQLAAISTCVGTLMFGIWRRVDLQKFWRGLDMGPSMKLFLAGGLGAAFVETEYVAWEHVTGAVGAAASPNLAMDLLETMPWYLLLLLFLGVALKHVRPSLFQLLLLGGVYELMSDGLLGSLIGGTLTSGWLFLLILIPIFTLVYSPIVVLPVLAVRKSYEQLWAEKPPTGSKLWLLFPCLAILIYGPFLISSWSRSIELLGRRLALRDRCACLRIVLRRACSMVAHDNRHWQKRDEGVAQPDVRDDEYRHEGRFQASKTAKEILPRYPVDAESEYGSPQVLRLEIRDQHCQYYYLDEQKRKGGRDHHPAAPRRHAVDLFLKYDERDCGQRA